MAIAGLDWRAARLAAVGNVTPKQWSDYQNAVGIVASWTLKHLARSPGAKPRPRYTNKAWKAAVAYWNLSNHYLEVEDGKRGYRSKGRRVYLTYEGDVHLEVLNAWLRLCENRAQEDAAPAFEDAAEQAGYRLAAWATHTGGTRTWFCTPDTVRDPLRRVARSIMALAPHYLPLDTPTPVGSSLGTIAAYWTEMLALGLYNNQLLSYLRAPFVALTPYSRDVVVRHMSNSANIPIETADEITTLLTQNREKVYDPALTPLLQLDDGRIFPMSSLIVPASPHRNILKILQADRDGYGPLGDLLGGEGEQTIARFLKERLGTHCHVSTNIPVKRGRKRDATDLDVVVYSPRENLLVILEVKWHLQSDGTYEARMHEREARERQDRLAKRRSAIRAGTETVQWPSGWNMPNNVGNRWFVITNDVFPTHDLGTSDIKMRPYALLKHMLPQGSSAEQLIGLLDKPPTPPVNKRQSPHKFGALTIYLETPDTPGFATDSEVAPYALGFEPHS